MAFCGNCGNPLDDNMAFCPNCGAQQAPAQAAPQQQYQQAAPQQQYQQEAPQQQYQQAAPQQQYQQAPVQAPVQVVDDDVAASKGVAWLSYVGLLWLIPFFVKKNYKYARFHVRQGATLFACELAYTLTYKLILLPIDLMTREVYFGYVIHSGFYNAMNIIFSLAEIFFVVVAIMGIVRAATGKKLELPLLGKIPFVKMLIDKWYTGMGVDVSNDD
ncbi:MAG: zinc ribbon domain-containing protein [Ruminococcus sp.]|nr:zinc ribbon domain-containing protein [Ruminococcus sp.]